MSIAPVGYGRENESVSDSWKSFDLAVAAGVLGERMADDVPTAAIDAMGAGAGTPPLPRRAAVAGRRNDGQPPRMIPSAA